MISRKSNRVLIDAIDELRAKGLVEPCGGGVPHLRLTLKGEHLLFST
jgi:hypothetical protein